MFASLRQVYVFCEPTNPWWQECFDLTLFFPVPCTTAVSSLPTDEGKLCSAKNNALLLETIHHFLVTMHNLGDLKFNLRFSENRYLSNVFLCDKMISKYISKTGWSLWDEIKSWPHNYGQRTYEFCLAHENMYDITRLDMPGFVLHDLVGPYYMLQGTSFHWMGDRPWYGGQQHSPIPEFFCWG